MVSFGTVAIGCGLWLASALSAAAQAQADVDRLIAQLGSPASTVRAQAESIRPGASSYPGCGVSPRPEEKTALIVSQSPR